MDQGLPDFVKKEILEVVQNELSSAIQINLSERVKSEIAETVRESLFEVLDDRMTEIVRDETRRAINEEGLDVSAPKRKVCLAHQCCARCTDCFQKRRITEEQDTNETVPEDRLDASKFPWPIYYPSEIPATPVNTQDVITVDAYNLKQQFPYDIIVGRARATACVDPNIRPLVRATLVTQNHQNPTRSRVYLYIPSAYGKVPDRMGELQIPNDQVEFLPQFTGRSKQERSAKISAALKKHSAEGADFTTVDTYTGSSFLDWDIVIGHARPEICADPAVRPLVRATLVSDERALAYMPARFGVCGNRTEGELLVAIRDVQVWREFDVPGEHKRREKIKEALVSKRGERVGMGCVEANLGEMDD
jgi:hypothetical protein